MNTLHATDASSVRQDILEAASQRFTQFGYNKTTMAEIAQDCGMSAANLYRYFENKLDIGANLASGCLGTKTDLMQEIVQDQARPAQARLYDMVMRMLHYTYNQWAENPRMNEMVNAICQERMDIVDEYKQREHEILMSLLEEGNASGEFEVADTKDTAMAMATAIAMFNIPLLMPMCDLTTFEQKAESVVRLMLNGILKNN
jgi:AcrR family transcriptional regulator